MDYETAHSNIKSLAEKKSASSFQDLNEATTRLRFIDEILFNCLDWDQSDCIAEERYEQTYADYRLRIYGSELIVEAKKEGIYFEIPAGFGRRTCPIQFFRSNFPPVYAAIEQAVHYCQERGVALGAVCNGHQLIAFLGSRTDGKGPLDGRALVFESLESMADDFLTLWGSLSKEGAVTRHLSLLLEEGPPQPVPSKLSTRITNYPNHRIRNQLQDYLKIVGDLAIEDLARRPESEEEFLQECYSENGPLSQYALISKNILESRYSALFQESVGGPPMVAASTRAGVDPTLLAESMAQRPILLVGDIGAGKTTFIRNLIRVGAKDVLSQAIVLYLDLGVKPTFETELHAFLAEEMGRQLRDAYSIDIDDRNFIHGVYNIELQQFEKGLYSDLRNEDPAEFRRQQIRFLESKVDDFQEHLRRCLEQIRKGHQRQIVIFLDNIDQRPEAFQQSAFLVGESIAELWPALVYISLRPETYVQSRISGAIGAYHVRVFTIAPPRIDRVIEKRLAYGKLLLERHGSDILTPGISFDVKDLIDYLEILIDSFANSGQLRELIDNLSGGNVRLALDFVRTFIGSGHVNTGEVLEIYRSSGSFTIALHHFLNAIIFGDYQDYDPNRSEIANVFDITSMDGKEHFLVCLILAHIDRSGQLNHANSEGYVPGTELFDFGQSIGFSPAQITNQLDKCFRHKLIESQDKISGIGEEVHTRNYYRITMVGGYYYKRLITEFSYLDAMTIDTPIIVPDSRAAIGIVRDIRGRLERAEIFRNYLDEQWKSLDGRGTEFDWPTCSSALSSHIVNVMRRLPESVSSSSSVTTEERRAENSSTVENLLPSEPNGESNYGSLDERE